ncbi:MAG TPA: toll/interleukin-1 receptor domain-containing protein, partial [Pedobacter sp.]|nr:toll/interleukin-1 receptor domain-containing protein [Pedobacter sp.]
GGRLDNVLPDNWLEIYNRLFELVDVRGDAATYFSGPRFINLVRQFLPYFANYEQYIDERNRQGKSTTRRIYYFDILKDLTPVVRNQVITEILNIIRPYDEHRVENIELLLFNKHSKEKEPVKDQHDRKPVIFISYSWDDENHKNWVLQLANRLLKDNVDVKLDRYLLRTGAAMQYTMEQAISTADKILIVFTPNYKLKADNRKGGVGYEYSIMNAGLYLNQTTNDKIIPVLRKGSIEESIPSFMQQYIHLDIRNDDNFENSYNDLKRDIFNEPSAFV